MRALSIGNVIELEEMLTRLNKEERSLGSTKHESTTLLRSGGNKNPLLQNEKLESDLRIEPSKQSRLPCRIRLGSARRAIIASSISVLLGTYSVVTRSLLGRRSVWRIRHISNADLRSSVRSLHHSAPGRPVRLNRSLTLFSSVAYRLSILSSLSRLASSDLRMFSLASLIAAAAWRLTYWT
jgi:hypothetical protein